MNTLTKRFLVTTMTLALLLGSACTDAGATPEPATDAESSPQQVSEVATEPTQGTRTYVGTASGMGKITVTITVDNGVISDTAVDTSNETPGYGYEISYELAQQILQAQSADIDGVSSSTITSNAVRAAAAQALLEAGLLEDSGGSMTPGVYIGTARGAKSDISMAVQVNEGSILGVWNLENGDTPVLSETAIETVVQAIVEHQSLSVDTLSGATLSSQGVIMAVAQALEAANGNTGLWYRDIQRKQTTAPTQEYDIVIVGAGASGLTAALAAHTDSQFSSAPSGLRVLVVESNGIAGGDMALCGGYIAAFSGTSLNEATGISHTPQEVTAVWKADHPMAADFINDFVMDKVVEMGPAVLNGLMNRGFYLSTQDAATGMVGSQGFEYTLAAATDPVTGERTGENGYDIGSASPYFGQTLSRLVEASGVEIRLNTRAESLVIQDGVCTGINVVTPDSTYQINASKVILCTGYSGWDAESVEMFYPEYKDVVPATNQAGNHGDPMKWIVEMGGEVANYKENQYIVPGYDSVMAHFWEEALLYSEMNTIWVDGNGNRYFDESGERSGRAMLELEKPGYAYMIFDGSHEGVRFYESLAAQGLAWSGDSLEELASQIDVPEETLIATVEQYNSDYANGEDTLFGTPVESMAPAETAPFYAVRLNASSPSSGNTSIYIDDDMTVLLRKDGARIENLYAAGGVCGNSFVNSGLGTHVFTALTSGAYAGECARDALLKQ